MKKYKILTMLLVIMLLFEGVIAKNIEADECIIGQNCNKNFDDMEQYNFDELFKLVIDEFNCIPKLKKVYSTTGVNNEKINLAYDLKGNLISEKVNNEWTFFTYDSNQNLLSIKNKNQQITFEYLDGEPIGFTYQNVHYYYVINECNVGIIKDAEQNEVAKYIYLEDGTQIVYSKNQMEQWVVNTDPQFIGNINPIRLLGMYYDKYLDWYYVNGYFYDDKSKCYVNEKNDLSQYKTELQNMIDIIINKLPVTYSADESLKEYIRQSAVIRYNNMIGNPNVGKPLGSSNDYLSLDTTELVARTIYGENSYRYKDEEAIAIVLANRLCTGYGKKGGYNYDIRNVVTAPSQFSAVIPGNRQFRRPTINDNTWDYSLMFACILCLTQEICPQKSYYTYVRALINTTSEINRQNSFYGLEFAKNNLKQINGDIFLGDTHLYDPAIAGYLK